MCKINWAIKNKKKNTKNALQYYFRNFKYSSYLEIGNDRFRFPSSSVNILTRFLLITDRKYYYLLRRFVEGRERGSNRLFVETGCVTFEDKS